MTGPSAKQAPAVADDDLDLPDEPLPVSVLTGFLGSGKTTLLNRLLAHPGMGETAVIVNEFGEIGLDHLLVETGSEDTVLLNSGCLCCTVRGDLIETMRRLFKQRAKREVPPFRRLAIETTGLADPAPILHTLMTDPLLINWFRLDGVIATVDAITGMVTLDQHEESLRQAAVADRLLLTKTDLADEPTIQDLKARLRSLNPAAPILTVVHGDIEPETLFNAGLYDAETKSPDVRRWLQAEAYGDPPGDHAHGHDVNRHDDRVRAFCLDYDKPLNWDNFNSWIEMLVTFYGADILRIKGILNVEGQDQPMVIHGVQHLFHPPSLLEAWPDEDRRSRLVFITRDLKREMFETTLQAFNETGPGPIPATPR